MIPAYVSDIVEGKKVRYCLKCEYVIPADYQVVVQIHIENCRDYLAGFDCMHLESKSVCECK